MTGPAFSTEHAFTLPLGYLDASGTLHRDGVMRLATAADEILPMKDPRVQALPTYLIVILLARVVVRLGSLPQVDPAVVEGLFSQDLTYLQELYNRVNGLSPPTVAVTCPRCEAGFELEAPMPGESAATPWNGSTRRSPDSDATSTGPTQS
ncbi:hypothetical protein [Nonomuraea jiangxiensis]|uniref:Phage tail assembly chaperone protein, E, or 41 or 14 n=1 Tax=Nonomuraea jiangxiensis TaxID=633440 RepID=A0A1G9PA50_9ACTN|nr:hypothetical protein [Nonomuraea jiangxiensis]SDL95639.1 hypothetical protein SAMN05421869_13382 [Nonomuraea jiangxiensis]